ncbi:MAG: hypothetical protein JNM12_04580 [Alphaproteobacteria bacterium]|nr:hypothetical protein [Alphaproteobacteria bacterium]
MIQANQEMLQILFDAALPEKLVMPVHLEKILAEGLIEEDGCWFLAACRKGTEGSIKQFGDRTGLESYVNGVHIDVITDRVELPVLRQQGLLYVQALRKLLQPKGVFGIVMGISQVVDMDDFSCTVRFYKVRSDEPSYAKDLDGFRDGAVLIFTTQNLEQVGQ